MTKNASQGMTKGLGILEFPTMSSPSLTGGYLYEILDLFLEILEFCLGNFRIFVIASEAISRNSRFILRNSRFILRNSRFILRNSKFSLGILNFIAMNFRFYCYEF